MSRFAPLSAAPAADQVSEALSGPAQHPSPELRAQMLAEHGLDFGDVRLHTDDRAGASALALGAAAYTVGRDIVFAPGAFAPHRAEGRQLLAHEAVHVQQQDGQRWSGGTLAVEPADAGSEREARSIAGLARAAGGPQGEAAPPVAVRRSGGLRVQRSLLGAIGGAIVGGVLGALLGPAGAVVGAIAGALGGAVVGDLATRRARPLSQPERNYLFDIYRDSVDYDRVTVTRGSALAAGAARTTGNTINLQDGHFVGNTLDLSEAGLLVLAHEMGHVWQYQNGGLAYIPSSLIPQIVGWFRRKGRNAAYDWRAAAAKRLPWNEWNAEQQAECISDYNEALRRVKAGRASPADHQTCALALPYIELVRRRLGAPGSPSRHAMPAGAGATGGPP